MTDIISSLLVAALGIFLTLIIIVGLLGSFLLIRFLIMMIKEDY